MADWSLMERDRPPNQYDPYQFPFNQFFQENQPPPCLPPNLAMPPPPPPPPVQQVVLPPYANFLQEPSTSQGFQFQNPPPPPPAPKPDNPREIRNKAEKQRRDKLNQSIGELASMVPPVVAASRKIDKTGVLRLTAHYLRAHQYVFGDSVNKDQPQFSVTSTRALLSILNGFLLTTTYRGLIVVVSPNVQQYLGYTELDLLGQNIFNLIHDGDRQLMRDMLMPKPHLLGPNGELLVPEEAEAKQKLVRALATSKRRFIVRFKKLGQRSEPPQYVTCHLEGNLRKSDRACRGYNRCCQMVRRARARGDNPCNSGNDVVFVGIVRVATESFITESKMESYRMEYRTRHSIDGQIIQSEQRISMVTGYMTHEVNGINAMNFMHRDDVRWVVIALREMYDQHRLMGESCYRLLTKNGQFIYMKTRGRLEVDCNTRAVTSFVCTNTVVDEIEGKHLIKIMKKKFMLLVNNNEDLPPEEEIQDENDHLLSVEDPKQLEKVILHLVTNLPAPQITEIHGDSPDQGIHPSERLAIIPPKKERIVRAIERIYSVIKILPRQLDRTPKIHLNKLDRNDHTNAVSDVMTFNSSPKSLSTSLALDAPHTSMFSENSGKIAPTLPNFSNVYSRRQPDPIGSMELNFTAASTSTRDKTLSMSQIPSTSYKGKATITLENIIETNNMINNKQASAINYHFCIPSPDDTEESNLLSDFAIPQPSGIKRPREPTETTNVEAVSKKKNTDLIKDEIFGEQNLLDDAPLLDTLFEETLFNTSFPQIEMPENALNESIDPIFPDLLISQEVQDILQEIEETQKNNQSDNNI